MPAIDGVNAANVVSHFEIANMRTREGIGDQN